MIKLCREKLRVEQFNSLLGMVGNRSLPEITLRYTFTETPEIEGASVKERSFEGKSILPHIHFMTKPYKHCVNVTRLYVH